MASLGIVQGEGESCRAIAHHFDRSWSTEPLLSPRCESSSQARMKEHGKHGICRGIASRPALIVLSSHSSADRRRNRGMPVSCLPVRFDQMLKPVATIALWLVVESVVETRRMGCASLNYCNGHGRCVAVTRGSPSVTCECFRGWGHPSDVATDHMLDCSQRTCPLGIATSDIPTSPTAAHPLRECSNNGLCDRETGECHCFGSWVGGACERRSCPKQCSGHGQCMVMAELATRPDAFPLAAANGTNLTSYRRAWDASVGVACLCDSTWAVGLGPGETQAAEWFGPDCSLRRCPSGDDPLTVVDETDCTNKSGGAVGNLCHAECAHRGICNTRTGVCACFDGFAGAACDRRAP